MPCPWPGRVSTPQTAARTCQRQTRTVDTTSRGGPPSSSASSSWACYALATSARNASTARRYLAGWSRRTQWPAPWAPGRSGPGRCAQPPAGAPSASPAARGAGSVREARRTAPPTRHRRGTGRAGRRHGPRAASRLPMLRSRPCSRTCRVPLGSCAPWTSAN